MPAKSKKITLKEVTSKVMMVTGAVSAITGCVKQIIEMVGCKPKVMKLDSMPESYIPPTHLEKLGHEIISNGLFFLAIGIAMIIVARRLTK